MPNPLRVAVVGHVQHVTVGRVPALPTPGGIAHLEATRVLAGGGGGIALFQLARGPTEAHAYTALGDDDGAAVVERALAQAGIRVHAARRRDVPHARDVVMVTPDGERAVVVVAEPLHARSDDPLPWGDLARFDAVYFTGEDEGALRAARAARVLVVSARRRHVLNAAGVRADAVVGSASDPREASGLVDYAVTPDALVMTEGARGGAVTTGAAVARFQAPVVTDVSGGAYGAGDSFAGALTFYLAVGCSPVEAATRAAYHGAAVLRGTDPLEHQLPLAFP